MLNGCKQLFKNYLHSESLLWTTVYSYEQSIHIKKERNTIYILFTSVTLEMYETSIRAHPNPTKNSRLYTRRSGAENVS